MEAAVVEAIFTFALLAIGLFAAHLLSQRLIAPRETHRNLVSTEIRMIVLSGIMDAADQAMETPGKSFTNTVETPYPVYIHERGENTLRVSVRGCCRTNIDLEQALSYTGADIDVTVVPTPTGYVASSFNITCIYDPSSNTLSIRIILV